jgi:Transient receptor potential (TRP) ion channel/ML-like domain
MRLPLPSCIVLIATFLTFTPYTSAIRLIESKSLNPCQSNSNFTATLFNVVFTPDNRTLAFDVVGVSSIQGNVTAELEVIAYGFTAVKQTLDPCTMDLGGLCPMSTGQINIQSNIAIGKDVINKIPGIAYGIPDLDGIVRIYINDTDSKTSIACVEAQLSNGKTVDQKAVGWATAVIAGLGLVASGVTSGMGHSNTAAHVAANALSLFGFFQAQAFIGMTAVKLPPIVQSWTQNFQWSMGIIRVGFMQHICTWYQRSTGGTPSTLLSTLATTSVQVQKRSLDVVSGIYRAARDSIRKRSNSNSSVAENTKLIVVRGIDRVGFRAGIEQTNIFLTGTIFFIVFCFFVGILIALFKGFCEVAVKNGWMKSDKFQDFRNGWKIVLKGILFRLVSFRAISCSTSF